MNGSVAVEMTQFRTDNERWYAVTSRNTDADGQFIYGVITTGVYCRPSCPSRGAKRENVRYYADTVEAKSDGLRPCKRCRPDQPSIETRRVDIVEAACRLIECDDTGLKIAEIADMLNISRHHFQRTFKAHTGLTPKAYQQAIRRGRLLETLESSQRVTDAIYDSGYDSATRFYVDTKRRLGMTPSVARQGGRGQVISYALADTTLGRILVAASESGICLVRFGDEDDSLLGELQAGFPAAILSPANGSMIELVQAVVNQIERPKTGKELPLDIQGTAFQERVWAALRDIPLGQTASYQSIAKKINQPTASRAVAQACGANPVAVLVPCHRVVRADGSLAGYRWGTERKAKLLERERSNTESSE